MKRLATFFLVAVALAPTVPRAEATPTPLSVLSVNVGNSNLNCQPYVFKLCLKAVEERASEKIAALNPDLVILIEVWPDGRCAEMTEVVPTKSCAGRDAAFSQATTLLGDGYDYQCGRFLWDCVAVRTDVGEFTSDLASAEPVGTCDAGFTVNAVNVTVRGRQLQVLAGHPDSGNDACRTQELQQLFAMAASPGSMPVLLAGDFNLDPYREDSASVALWKAQVGVGRRFTAHNDDTHTFVPAEASQLDPTGALITPVEAPMPAGPLMRRTIDHVASDGLSGPQDQSSACEVIRIDGGGGMDHRALDCALEFAT